MSAPGADRWPSFGERLDRLESEGAVRRLAARYFELCDRLEEADAADAAAQLFAEDAVWAGAGSRYGSAFGEVRGRPDIARMLTRYGGAPAFFALNAHFLGGESIVVEGDAAEGRWTMLQTSTYASGPSDLRAARIAISFVRRRGRWVIARFLTENLFSRRVDHWNDDVPIPVPNGAQDAA